MPWPHFQRFVKAGLDLFTLAALVSVIVFNFIDLTFQSYIFVLHVCQFYLQLVHFTLLLLRIFKLAVNLVLKSTINFHKIIIKSGKFINSIECFNLILFVNLILSMHFLNFPCKICLLFQQVSLFCHDHFNSFFIIHFNIVNFFT